MEFFLNSIMCETTALKNFLFHRIIYICIRFTTKILQLFFEIF